ncbi:MAG: transcriptional coactivator p15/PC4 family protein [Elusimicrobiota bacterium]
MIRNKVMDGVMFMNAERIATIAKNKSEEIRVSLLRNNKVDVRMYFYFPNELEPKPTKKGVWLSPKHTKPIVAALKKLLENSGEEVKLEFLLSDREQLRAYTGEYMDTKLFHIRTFYQKEGEFLPGKGISFPVTLTDKMHEALKIASQKQQAA